MPRSTMTPPRYIEPELAIPKTISSGAKESTRVAKDLPRDLGLEVELVGAREYCPCRAVNRVADDGSRLLEAPLKSLGIGRGWQP
jgi:hypothetical protein